MRKAKLKNGIPFFGIKIEHFVTKSAFATAIASHCWCTGEEFDPKSSKKKVFEILKKNLFHQGLEGVCRDHWDGASEEFSKPFDMAYSLAIEWIEKNYPYLNK